MLALLLKWTDSYIWFWKFLQAMEQTSILGRGCIIPDHTQPLLRIVAGFAPQCLRKSRWIESKLLCRNEASLTFGRGISFLLALRRAIVQHLATALASLCMGAVLICLQTKWLADDYVAVVCRFSAAGKVTVKRRPSWRNVAADYHISVSHYTIIYPVVELPSSLYGIIHVHM